MARGNGQKDVEILRRNDIIDRKHAERVVIDRLKRIQRKINKALGDA